jgi:D-beta-D-heptose 7-phosphate kinase/D-beta-D-heptose 1-phosphate adenosyltransferase
MSYDAGPTAGSIIERFSGCHVIIVGDAMLDEYVWGDVGRVCPEAPVPVVEEVRRSIVPGGMANVAANAAALGAHVAAVGVTGEDPHGAMLRDRLLGLGIDTSGLRSDPKRCTTVKTRVIARNQQVVRVDREDTSPISVELEDALLDSLRSLLLSANCCVVSDYAKGVLSPRLTAEIIDAAELRGVPVIVDPKGWDYSKYQGASVITPNLNEARMALTKDPRSPMELPAIGEGLRKLLPGTAVLVTLGPEGVALFQETHDPLCIPSAARQVYDVTGAGDTLIATLAVAVAAGYPIIQAATIANVAAGLAVGKVGTASVSASELLRADIALEFYP